MPFLNHKTMNFLISSSKMGSALSANIGWNCSLGEFLESFLWGPSNAMKFGNFTQWQEKVCGEKPTPQKKQLELGTKMQKLMGCSLFKLQFFPANNTAGELGQSNFCWGIYGWEFAESHWHEPTKAAQCLLLHVVIGCFLQIARGSSIPGMSSVESAVQ